MCILQCTEYYNVQKYASYKGKFLVQRKKFDIYAGEQEKGEILPNLSGFKHSVQERGI